MIELKKIEVEEIHGMVREMTCCTIDATKENILVATQINDNFFNLKIDQECPKGHSFDKFLQLDQIFQGELCDCCEKEINQTLFLCIALLAFICIR